MRNRTATFSDPIKAKRSVFKSVLGCVLILIVAGIIAAIIGFNWYRGAIYTPASTAEGNVELDVIDGDTLFSIAEKLQKQGVVSSLDAFRIYQRLNPIDIKVQTGFYRIPKSINVPDLIAKIAEGPITKIITATFPEGLRYDEILSILEDAYAEENVEFNRADFEAVVTNPDQYEFSEGVEALLAATKPAGKNLEGYLFPDTYNIGADATPANVIDLFIRTLIIRLEQNKLPTDNAPRLSNNFYQVLNLASIVQREARVYADMQNVSDVFLKRLENRWYLEADASLLYPLKRWTPGLTQAELANDTPYNTYKRFGLPPTPISNPGIEAISSVLNYTANPYYFYITDKDGIKRYAKTFQEHQNNIARYGLAF